MRFKLGVLTKQRNWSWKLSGAGGQWDKGQKPEDHVVLHVDFRVGCFQGCCLILLSFVVDLLKKLISNSMSSWWQHTDFHQNFHPDWLKPEEVNSSESKSLITQELRLVFALCSLLWLITPTIYSILWFIRQNSLCQAEGLKDSIPLPIQCLPN